MSESSLDRHPGFQSPPVTEVALGIEFIPLSSWGIPHFGLFWQHVRDRFPSFEVKEPVIAGGRPLPPVGALPVRCWFLSKDGTELLQIQDDRLVLNWRKLGDGAYPRYQAMRPKLQDLWHTFVDFLDSEGITRPDVQQCEFTYVNHIDIQELASKNVDLAKMFAFWEGGPSGFLRETNTLSFGITTVVPDATGQITVSTQPVVQIQNNLLKQVLQLTFTSRFRPRTSAPDDVFAALDTGHNWNVRAFLEFTSHELQEAWGRSDIR